MPLRLRRGTNAERQLVTPQSGELIYVTDYEIRSVSPLWVGDGFTPGGNPVETRAGTLSLGNLTDVDLNSVPPQIGDVLKWNGAVFAPQPDIDTGALSLNNLSDVDLGSVPLQVGDLLKWNGEFFVPQPFETLVDGSNYRINIIGDDSTILVDTVTGSIRGDFVTTNTIYYTDTFLSIKNSNSLLRSVVEIESNDDLSRLVISRASTSVIDDTMIYGRLDFKKDDLNSSLIKAAIGADNLGLFFTYSPIGIGEIEADYVTLSSNSNFGIGTWTPTEKLDVRGNASITGYTQFGSLSTVDRDSISAANGMVIYNSTANRFQGYQNNAWINLDDGSVA